MLNVNQSSTVGVNFWTVEFMCPSSFLEIFIDYQYC